MSCNLSLRIISALTLSFLSTSVCLAQHTGRISVNANGGQANSTSWAPSVSENGLYVAFHSSANNLVLNDTNGRTDVFLKNTQTGEVTRISVDANGLESNGNSSNPSITPDGRYVVYESSATNIVPGDTDSVIDIYRYDRFTGSTWIASVSSNGSGGNAHSFSPTVSDNGVRVAFMSLATNLVGGDTNGAKDVFVHDFRLGTTERASIDTAGMQGNDDSQHPSISANGDYVAFESFATNLVNGDFNGATDCFVRDFSLDITVRESTGSLDEEGNHHSRNPVISADGRYMAFESHCSNFFPNDSVTLDIFVKDRWTGLLERASQSSDGTRTNDDCYDAELSNDGRYVVWWSLATSLIPNDFNSKRDVFVRDRTTGVTERVSVWSHGAECTTGYCVDPDISPDGQFAAFRTDGVVTSGDTNGFDDLFLHDRWSGDGTNSIYLQAPSTASVGSTIDFNWQTTRGGSSYWLAYSLSNSGSVAFGHTFDLGPSNSILISGVNAMNGVDGYTTAPINSNAAGYTVYFEAVAMDSAGVLYDSNVRAVTIN